MNEASQPGDDLERLFREAQPRSQPPEEARARVREEVLGVWEAEVRNVRRRRTAVLAVAAAAVAAVGLGVLDHWFVDGPANVPGAYVMRAQGDYRLTSAGKDLYAGDTVHTAANGFVQLRLAGGAQVRLDANSTLSVHDAAIELHSGRVYVDVAAADASVAVEARGARVTDIGTQFEVDVRAQALSIAVREGEVLIVTPTATHRGSAGEGIGHVIEIGADGAVARANVATTGERWEWIMAGARTIELGPDITVYDFMTEVAREYGRKLVWKTSAVEWQARKARWSQLERPVTFELKPSNDQFVGAYLGALDFRLLPTGGDMMVVDVNR